MAGPAEMKQISGVVRIIRGEPQTEVFFKDLKDSVIIPKDSKHNEIYALCADSMKTGKPVSLMMDPVSRRAYLKTTPSASTPAATSGSSSQDQGLDSSD